MYHPQTGVMSNRQTLFRLHAWTLGLRRPLSSSCCLAKKTPPGWVQPPSLTFSHSRHTPTETDKLDEQLRASSNAEGPSGWPMYSDYRSRRWQQLLMRATASMGSTTILARMMWAVKNYTSLENNGFGDAHQGDGVAS